MSGHSKWSTIKRKKGVKDAQKGKLFSKISRIVTLAVIEGGGIGDPDKNIRLRMALERARDANMPKENIARAIEKATGAGKDMIKEHIYEAFWKEGIMMIIQSATDNTNRAISEIRNVLERSGGKLGNIGSVMHSFQKCAVVIFDKSANSIDAIYEKLDGLNIIDMEEDDQSIIAYIPFDTIGAATASLPPLIFDGPHIDYKPAIPVELPPDKSAQLERVIELLEDLDDVTKVYTNALSV